MREPGAGESHWAREELGGRLVVYTEVTVARGLWAPRTARPARMPYTNACSPPGRAMSARMETLILLLLPPTQERSRTPHAQPTSYRGQRRAATASSFKG